MPVHDDLGKRMKGYYEAVPKNRLMRRCPVIIRIDGKAFHSFTKNFQRPFDELLIETMQKTMKYLCENVQGCVLGYAQSDEISLVLVDYKKLETNAWFDYAVQKMCSISASMATMAFNKIFRQIISEQAGHELYDEILDVYCKAAEKGAMFDSRCFNIPKEEVTNYFYWRQLDATRNSILMAGQAFFSHKELQNKACNMIQDMLIAEKNIDWNDYQTHQKRGSCAVKTEAGWVVDLEIPVFKGDGREYIDSLVYVGEG